MHESRSGPCLTVDSRSWFRFLFVGPLLLFPVRSTAQTDTLRIDEVIAAVVENNPALGAARLSVDAARERGAPAGALPDPTITLGLLNRPLDLGADQMMTMNSIQLQQRIPWPGIQAFSRQQFDLLAESESMSADELEQQLVSRAVDLYYRAAFADRALGVMDRTRQLLESFAEIASRKYEVGTAIQQDVLQAQVAVAQIAETIIVTRQQREAVAARLNSLMSLPPHAEHGAFDLPVVVDTVPSVDSLMAIATHGRPALRAAALRIEAADAAVSRARRDRLPDLTLGLSYGQRPNFSDLMSLSVGVSVPIWSGSRQGPQLREQEALRSAAEARELELYNETYAQLLELRAEIMSSARLLNLYRTSILPQAHAATEAALSAYRVGTVDYMTLVESQMTANQYEIESHRLAAAYHGAAARIRALTGTAAGGTK